RWPTCGGSKLQPKSAISMAEDYLDSVKQEGRAPLDEGIPLRVPGSAQLRDGPAKVHARAKGGAAGEEIDGRDVLDELVLLGPPLEPGRVLRAGVHDAGGAEPHGREGARVGDVDLDALAARSLVLVPG